MHLKMRDKFYHLVSIEAIGIIKNYQLAIGLELTRQDLFIRVIGSIQNEVFGSK